MGYDNFKRFLDDEMYEVKRKAAGALPGMGSRDSEALIDASGIEGEMLQRSLESQDFRMDNEQDELSRVLNTGLDAQDFRSGEDFQAAAVEKIKKQDEYAGRPNPQDFGAGLAASLLSRVLGR